MLTKASGINVDLSKKRIDHSSLWSKIELIQNKVIDLKQSISRTLQTKLSRPTSSVFDKTRSYFESEVMSDAALRELQEMNSIETKTLTGFHCIGMEMSSEGILITTNENFLFFGRKSFKSESFRRIQVDVNAKARVEHISLFFTGDEDIILIALNDGTVKSLCCEQNADNFDDGNSANSDIEDGALSLGVSIPTIDTDAEMPATNLSIFGGYGDNSTSMGSIAVASSIQGNFPFDGSAGKSCTIQSLVQNERKLYDETQSLNHLDNNEYKTSAMSNDSQLGDERSIRSINLMNGQILMDSTFGFFTRQTLIPLAKSFKIIVARMDCLYIYDILTLKTIKITANELNMKSILSASVSMGHHDEEYLVRKNI